MIRTMRVTLMIAVLASAGLHAQESDSRGGWTFTPKLGFGETYDDNVSLFGRNSAENQNDDLVAHIAPAADLRYRGKHTSVDMGYGGSFLDYRTFSLLNRWDQHAQFELRRQETARLKWYGHASAAVFPTTDLVEFGGIPYRHTGAKTTDGRAGIDYALNARNSISQSLTHQVIAFDRTQDVGPILRGGRVTETMTTWRRKMNSRFAIGADYSYRYASVYRFASVLDDRQTFNIHTTQAAADYELSPLWSLSTAAGVVYLQATTLTPSSLGPAGRATINRHRNGRSFHLGYSQSYIPSFGFGGAVRNQEISVSYRTPLFSWRRFSLDNSAIFRDNQPLTNVLEQLPLRSLRISSVLAWEPQAWVRLEAFYTRVQQTSLRVGGQIERNRVGFQIVTFKPMRIE